ncbi:lipid ABC transporter permease/ATP-binding protein [Halioglobus sp. HI00S01]|uniref:lipid A export permease/ATP-binding protein MsbA n=1 Tax=Halioglobus sp. HI00S01 TaxID=1822214 RepID=UPI0007C2943F|nr:lipid A export permease/ATP-binding protein MsbA [Halioglobus sp. HI00S01]KZX60227.1 lipid ABC transporter permease/ATP-binding protein [Halioglobus sp. HI00S01]
MGSKSRHPGIPRRGEMSDWQLYGRLLRYIVPYWWVFAFSLVGYIVYSLGSVLFADMMQFLLDALNNDEAVDSGIVSGFAYRLFYEPGMDTLEFTRVAFPVFLVAIAFLRAMGFFVGTYFMNHVARNLIHELRCQLFDKMLVAPSAYYDAHNQGVLISKITFNVEQVSGAVTKALKIIVREGLLVIGLLTYMLYLNWRLTLVFFLVAPFIAGVVVVVGKYFRRYSRRIQSSMGDVTQVSNESIGAYKEVRIFGGQEQQSGRFHKASAYNRTQSLKLALVDAASTPVIQTLLAVALGALVWFALDPRILTDFSGGKLVAFLTAAGQLGKPIRSLSGVQAMVQRGLAAAEDIFAQLDQPGEPDSSSYRTDRARGDIEFTDLSFAYPGSDAPVLRDFSLAIHAGETVALVGRSGSGKSTLVQLLMRFYDPASGAITLDGRELSDYQLANLRDQIAMVSQNVTLFHDTVYNNIAYGTLAEKGEAEVMAALDSAYASDFIERMPEGVNTMLGDDGGGLSGGQRQRLAIARAILKDAPIIVLDEATSALDNESEHRIQKSLDGIMEDRTTIIIAHRLSTVERADRIVVMDSGEITAVGTHQELLAAGGIYAQLYHQEFAD